MIDRKRDDFIETLLRNSLIFEYRRLPTREELFEAILEFYGDQANMTREEMSAKDMEDRAKAFPSYQYHKVYEVSDPRYDGFLDCTDEEIEQKDLENRRGKK